MQPMSVSAWSSSLQVRIHMVQDELFTPHRRATQSCLCKKYCYFGYIKCKGPQDVQESFRILILPSVQTHKILQSSCVSRSITGNQMCARCLPKYLGGAILVPGNKNFKLK